MRSVGLKEFLQTDDRSRSFRGDQVEILRIPFECSSLTLVVCCSPANRVWRFPRFDRIHMPTHWQARLTDELLANGMLERELKKNGLRRRSLPKFLLEIGEDEKFVVEEDEVDPHWFSCALLPNEFVEMYMTYVSEWVAQLGEEAFASVDDRLWLAERANLWRRAYAGLGQCLGLVSEANLFSAWAGESGLLAQAESIVRMLEGGTPARQIFGSAPIDFINDPINLDRAHLLRVRSRRHGDPAFLGENLKLAADLVDRALAVKTRLLRLLDYPHYYVAAEGHLAVLTAATASVPPLSSGLPFVPSEEIENYLNTQRARYPVLCVDPYLNLLRN